MSDEQPFLMPGVFSRRFILISLVIIVLTTIAVVFFDNTDDEAFNFMEFNPIDTTTPAPYKARNPEVITDTSMMPTE